MTFWIARVPWRPPEGTRRVVDPELAGLAEAIRCSGIGSGSLLVTSAKRSHRIAGVIDGYAVVVNLPGSETGLEVFIPLLDHVLDQLSGGDRA